MRVAAFVDDLMDRSRVRGAVPEVVWARTPDDCEGADVVVIDLVRHADRVAEVRECAPGARIVAFGPHVDDEAFAAARAAGADVVVARSRFFRDPAATLA